MTGHETPGGSGTNRAAPHGPDTVSFGPFFLHDRTRLLEKDGVPVKLGVARWISCACWSAAPVRWSQRMSFLPMRGPASSSRRSVCGFTSPKFARRSATERRVRAMSRTFRAAAIALSRPSQPAILLQTATGDGEDDRRSRCLIAWSGWSDERTSCRNCRLDW